MTGLGIAGGSLGSIMLSIFVIAPIVGGADRTVAAFGLMFLAVGIGFGFVTIALTFLHEPAREEPNKNQPLKAFFSESLRTLREDRNYRRAVGLQFCFVGAFTLMMFYIAYAKTLIPYSRVSVTRQLVRWVSAAFEVQ